MIADRDIKAEFGKSCDAMADFSRSLIGIGLEVAGAKSVGVLARGEVAEVVPSNGDESTLELVKGVAGLARADHPYIGHEISSLLATCERCIRRSSSPPLESVEIAILQQNSTD
jgi:hypothetical protein